MKQTQIELGFSIYDSHNGAQEETFNLSFKIDDESLGTIFDKFEIMLSALGFVLDGKELRLVNREDNPEYEEEFLTEFKTPETNGANAHPFLRCVTGEKD